MGHYFFKDDEVPHLDTGIYVVSKDWTVKNIDRFVEIMETLGYEKTIMNKYVKAEVPVEFTREDGKDNR